MKLQDSQTDPAYSLAKMGGRAEEAIAVAVTELVKHVTLHSEFFGRFAELNG